MSSAELTTQPDPITEAALLFLEAARTSAQSCYEEYQRQGYNSSHIEDDFKKLAKARAWITEGRPENDRLKSLAVTMQYGGQNRTLALDGEKWVLKGGYRVSDGESASDIRDPIHIERKINGETNGQEQLPRWLEAMDLPGEADGPIVSASSF